MTVAELIEQLQQYPGHREVVMKDSECFDWYDLKEVAERQAPADGWSTPQVVLS